MAWLSDGEARCAVVFEAGDPPRTGRLVLWRPDGTDPDTAGGDPGELTVVVEGPRARTVPVRRLPVPAALPLLVRAHRSGEAHPAAAFWGAVAVEALHLVARGLLLPGVSPGGFGAWQAGPLDASATGRLRALAAAMPPHARAVPLPGHPGEWVLPDAETLVRAFFDAVADTLPRDDGAAAPLAFSAPAPRRVPELREWAEEIGGASAGLRISLRVEGAAEVPDGLRAVVQAHAPADPALVADVAELRDGAAFGPRARMDAMVAVRRAARVWPPLDRLLHRAVPDELPLTDEEVGELLGRAAAGLAAAGVEVHWPRELARELDARPVVAAADPPPTDLPAFFGGLDALSLDWRLALDGEPLTEAEMDLLAEAHRPVVRLRDRWTLVDPELARRARERGLKPLAPMEALGAALTGVTEIDGERVAVAPSGWLESLRERVAADPESVAQPPELAAELRGYQLTGLRRLARTTSLGLGGCLADDMGLGKTITLIALHLHRQADPATAGPTLVVCPASLLGNWEREIRRFAPGVPVHRFHGPGRSLPDPAAGFVLTTYATMRLDAARLAGGRWALAVADEAQHVKNPASGTARALREIPAAARVALTGTPVENNLSELWAILDWTTPGLLGTLAGFRARWAAPIESGEDPVAAERFARLVRPFLLRRRKSDPGIAPELPRKTETDRPVALTREQAGLYEAFARETMDRIAGSAGMARRGLVFKLFTGLKQICNHPAQYLKEPDPVLVGRSGKLELLDELVDTIVAEGGAVLVFTQYVAMARLIERHLAGRGVPAALLHGGTPVPRREELVRAFQGGGAPVFLLSLKAAGTGLNLTRADHVVHYDRWWNPAVEDQATDRAYRIGQTRPVQVHRLIAEGTVEDLIAGMLRTKRALADSVLRSGEAALSELSDAELADLVELRGPIL
ncbi:ATP-dependent helicase [Actinomadura craniellae]|uniref:ATP-dependent helicase n=1 Tax=Actinomadura craniellae TaxID=2231787 RepID=A0A365GVP9_9ACTN|nr:DEAD/DEAH box helicase [Actinomadura craniellae]RAY10828.1 ATP-dependent helicase [Actinomadura craniellae]